MKKKATLELVEQSEKVSLYSISFAMDRTTEFERFLERFDQLIRKDIEEGIVTIEERELKHIEDREYWI